MSRRSATSGGSPLGRLNALVIVALLIALGWWLQASPDRGGTAALRTAPVATAPTVSTHADALPAFLPREARDTLALIARGGPYPHPQDGGVFGNREGHLPQRERGYYREYTVETPGIGHRGARRIVTGGKPPRIYYYTDDHYDSFRSFELSQ